MLKARSGRGPNSTNFVVVRLIYCTAKNLDVPLSLANLVRVRILHESDRVQNKSVCGQVSFPLNMRIPIIHMFGLYVVPEVVLDERPRSVITPRSSVPAQTNSVSHTWILAIVCLSGSTVLGFVSVFCFFVLFLSDGLNSGDRDVCKSITA